MPNLLITNISLKLVPCGDFRTITKLSCKIIWIKASKQMVWLLYVMFTWSKSLSLSSLGVPLFWFSLIISAFFSSRSWSFSYKPTASCFTCCGYGTFKYKMQDHIKHILIFVNTSKEKTTWIIIEARIMR